jgi:TPR repeat protein
MQASAHQDHGLALHGLGVMYLYGECVDKDESEALKWFRRAADQGLAGSLTTLAMMYQEGMGVDKDPEHARKLYQQAGFE